jgi:glycosyltransferase involved in cell wall biosynthesis
MSSDGGSERPLLWVHSHFLLPTGGTKYVFEVVRRIAERRPVEVAVESASPLWRERYADHAIPLHEMGGRTSTSLAYWGGFPAYLRRDRRWLQTRIASCSAVVSSFFPMPYLIGEMAKTAGIRHLTLCFEPFPFFHDDEVIRLYPRGKQWLLGLLRGLYGHIDTKGIRQADRIVTLNAVTQAEIAKTYDRRDAIPVYAGVDTTIFHPYSEAETRHLRRRIGTGPIAIHSTDYSPIKRTDLALRAFAAAAREVTDAHLVVTSTREDSRQLDSLRALASDIGVGDRVHFLGFVPFEDLPKWYSLASVLLQTGTSAGSGATSMSLPVKEAMACGTPAVRSNTTDEDVIDGVSGYLVDPLDSVATGAKVAQLLVDQEFARTMGAAGRERITSLYTWEKVVRNLLDALDS